MELLLALAMCLLLFQLFPCVPEQILSGLDFRQWSRSTWFLFNAAILILLFAVRIGPALVDHWKSRQTSQLPTSAAVPVVVDRNEDVRVLMRRDEVARARLRRQVALYAFGVPALVVAAGGLVGWWRGWQAEAERTANSLLPDASRDDWHATDQGVVGIKVRIRPDRDVVVTQLGLFDANEDGLQLTHRVGILDPAADIGGKKPLLVEVEVPYGRSAPLQDSFRWVMLERPVTLQSGHDYILAAEAMGYVEDNWPAMFTEGATEAAGMKHGWNPLIVGDDANDVKELTVTTQPWPAVPDQPLSTKGGFAHGYANMIATPIE